jgi:hypothetical protein
MDNQMQKKLRILLIIGFILLLYFVALMHKINENKKKMNLENNNQSMFYQIKIVKEYKS